MWRRTYLFLLLVRLWVALEPSYLHPDENFQGPEVIAGRRREVFPLQLVPENLICWPAIGCNGRLQAFC